MAERHSRVFGTEDDKDNCSFFHKTGCCRHGDRCSRKHIRPNFSVTLTIPHMYVPPPPEWNVSEQEYFEDFFEDVLDEVKKYGYVDDMIVIENLGEHMNGNLYIKYSTEEEAEVALKALTGRLYAGIPLQPVYCPVTDFKDSRCRQYDDETCHRGGFCNFMHIRRLPRWLKHELEKCSKRYAQAHGRDRGERDRERDYERRDKERDRGFDYGFDRERERERPVDRGYGDYPRDSRETRDSRGMRDPREGRSDRDRERGDERGGRDRFEDRGSDRGSDRGARSASEERKAMIAAWQQQQQQ